MLKNAIDDILCAVDQIDDSLRKTDLVDQLKNKLHGHRHLLRRLHNVSVPGGNSIGQIPERYHAREVEGRDRRAHTHWLADH